MLWIFVFCGLKAGIGGFGIAENGYGYMGDWKDSHNPEYMLSSYPEVTKWSPKLNL
jgi:hypothetical protein